jgi:putative ABC transport system permease protein
VGYVALEVLLAHAPLSLPRVQSIAIDGWALLFSGALATLTGMGFGTIPALQASKVNLVEVMNASARGSSAGGQGRRLRSTLVVVEFALALVLLVAAGLLLHSFVKIQQVPLGYEPEGSFISRIFTQERHYPDGASRIRFVDAAVERLSAVPGVEAVVFASRFPAYYRTQTRVAITGRDDIDSPNLPQASYVVATKDYFRALGITLEQGRLFDAHDDAESPPATVVSRGFARHFFPGENPVGRQITLTGNNNTVHTIVGVVGTVRDWGPLEETPFQVYVPYAQQPFPSPHLLVRVNRDFAAVEPALRRALDQVDPGMPLSFNGMDLQDFTNEMVAQRRYALFLFVVFSVVALSLCALGIYGVVAFSVTQRTKEVGIRMALGAQIADVVRLILADVGRQMAWGLVLGLAIGVIVMRYLSTLLYQVSAHDPLTYVAVSLVLVLVGALAGWLPARRAARIDPCETLRAE